MMAKKVVKNNLFKVLAEDSLTLSRLHNGREKLETEDVVDKPLTIDDFDMVYTAEATYAVIVFKEHPKMFYNCGLILTKMVQRWTDEYKSVDVAAAAYEKLSDEEKVKVMLKEGEAASSGNSLTLVEIL